MEVVEYTPTAGSVRRVVKALKLVEDALLFWVPLLGAGILILVLLLRALLVVGKKVLRKLSRAH